MSTEYALELTIVNLTRAKSSAQCASLDWHFTSEIDHLIMTAQANKDALRRGEGDEICA